MAGKRGVPWRRRRHGQLLRGEWPGHVVDDVSLTGVVGDGGRLDPSPGAAFPGCLRSASSSPWAAAIWALVSASSRRSWVSLAVRVAPPVFGSGIDVGTRWISAAQGAGECEVAREAKRVIGRGWRPSAAPRPARAKGPSPVPGDTADRPARSGKRIDGVSRSLPYSDLLALTSSHRRGRGGREAHASDCAFR